MSNNTSAQEGEFVMQRNLYVYSLFVESNNCLRHSGHGRYATQAPCETWGACLSTILEMASETSPTFFRWAGFSTKFIHFLTWFTIDVYPHTTNTLASMV